MAKDRFLIAPFNTGLQTNLRPWLIMDDAFEVLENAYVFRGRVRKRFGGTLTGTSESGPLTSSRLGIPLPGGAGVGTTDGAGNATGTVPGAIFKVGQMFSIGTQLFTVVTTGVAQPMLNTGIGAATYSTTNGNYTFTGVTANTQIIFYPSEPVMGIDFYESGAIDNYPTYAFDTQFAYTFNGASWVRSGTGTNPVWHGTNLNFFWVCNWEGAADNNITMYVTNFNATIGAPGANDDPIWFTQDGATWTSATGANAFYFAPGGGAIHTGPFIRTARLIISFKNRLLLLNTIESNAAGDNNTAFVNRCRFSHNGSPLAANAWYEPNQSDAAGNTADGGGFIDATTQEAIISAEFIKDRLIVFFELSTWELAYTGNEIQPFIWQKINTELGCNSEMSTVPFDKFILTVGQTGIHACNGANVERIDLKIPDQVFQIQSQLLDTQRVYGIRDYYTECVYWTFASSNEINVDSYPNKILLYNYRNESWAIFDDCITAFGYLYAPGYLEWQEATDTWEEHEQQWQAGILQRQFRLTIAGNQQGWIFICNPDISRNAPVMQITNMVNAAPNITLTVVNHTLAVGDYVAIENAQGVTGVNGNIYMVQSITNSSTVVVGPATFTGTYTGGGTLARVSNYNILSKQWNPYVEQDRNVYISKIDFGVEKTSNGQVTVDYYPSSTELSMINEGTVTGTIMGTGVLETSPYNPAIYPLEQVQTRLWHPIYLQTSGECIQINIYMNQNQITTPNIAWSDFQLEGMVLYASPTSDRLQ